MRRGIATAVLVSAALTAPSPARAGLVPVQVSVTPEGGLYRFTYAIVLPTNAQLRPGDYFTIYNFDGFVPGSDRVDGTPLAADWSFASSTTGQTPPGVLPDDNPVIPNLTWTYHGTPIGNDQIGLGNFWALSRYPDTTRSWFAASTGTVSGVTDNNVTPTTVPVPTAPPPGVPEPATLLLAGLGLPVVGAARWLRRGRREPAVDTRPGRV